MMTPPLAVMSFGVAVLASTIAAVTDSRTGRIPDWITLPAAAFGIIAHAALGGGASAGISLLGLMLAGSIPAALHGLSKGRAIGGGDVKLFAALGALLGPVPGIETEFGAFVLLIVFSLIRLAFRGQLARFLGNAAGIVINPLLPHKWRRRVRAQDLTEVRMGTAIAVSVLTTIAIEQGARVLPWLE